MALSKRWKRNILIINYLQTGKMPDITKSDIAASCTVVAQGNACFYNVVPQPRVTVVSFYLFGCNLT